MKKICILGSTGSIGTQTLEVVKRLSDIQVVGLSVQKNIDLLEKQIYQFKPKKVAVMEEQKAQELQDRIHNTGIEVLAGIEGLIEIAQMDEADLIVTAVVGMIGLRPTLAAIEAKKDIALANKETLVTAGALVMEAAKQNQVSIYPVDSEHSAIFQCLQGNDFKDISQLLLTASGGPFRRKTKKELHNVTKEQALKHPNWNMGAKITIDSATMMNKGLEVIEAKWLFDVELDQIQVLVHPQSIIHSMVEFQDGSIIAQLGEPDMRVPIQYALTYPKRQFNSFPKLDLLQRNKLTFEKPDKETFLCLALAYQALKEGGTMPTVLNAANEAVVAWFLEGKITFLEIPILIQEAMEHHKNIQNPSLEDILYTEQWTYQYLESR
ncbi:MAG: 1-deoxy-D-xylulose-5-phosphate reductoisomerase [Epulopiscium sp.]|nr:1-deoxy-D-xylulose-5-phosphate reductoisomerase [Candidatus Epulonipiscium sp.]